MLIAMAIGKAIVHSFGMSHRKQLENVADIIPHTVPQSCILCHLVKRMLCCLIEYQDQDV